MLTSFLQQFGSSLQNALPKATFLHYKYSAAIGVKESAISVKDSAINAFATKRAHTYPQSYGHLESIGFQFLFEQASTSLQSKDTLP